MKLAIVAFAALVAVAAAASLDEMVLSDALINEINASNGGWTAGRNPRFEGVTVREARAMLGALPSGVHLPRHTFSSAAAEVSASNENYDAREAHPECADLIGGILDQGRCGSCWAFAASEHLAARTCIASSGSFQEVLSAQDMVSCDTGNYGCQGGYLDVSMNYLANSGVVLESCFPYVSGKDGKVPACPSECPGTGSFDKTFGKDPRDISGVATMEKDLQAHGPFEIGFTVYRDFMAYKSGVYKHTSRDVLGGHAVEIIGFGTTDDGEDYWMVANSWGASWGMDGFFMIAKGINECGLERQAVSVSAKDAVAEPEIHSIFRKL